MDFLLDNWNYILLGIFVAEKIVKVTPTKYDDIIVDVIIKGLYSLVSKKR
jgi:hypothetical protein